MWSIQILLLKSIFQSKINHKHFGIHIQPESEHEKRRLNRTTILCGRDRMNLTDEFDLCDNEFFYQTRISSLKLVSYLGFKPKLPMRYPIKVGIWRIGKCKKENL